MPAQTYDLDGDGLSVTVRDKRRWRRFIPFYTDFFRTSFWVSIERHAEPNPDGHEIPDGGSLYIRAMYSDGIYTADILEVPQVELSKIEVGNQIRRETRQILISPPGQTLITYGHDNNKIISLFSFFVVSESSVMAGTFALILSLFILVGTLGGAVLGAWLQPDPVVIQQFALPTAADELPLTPMSPAEPTPDPDELPSS